MKSHLTCKLLIASALLAGCIHADVSYAVPSGSSDSDGALSGTVDFFLTNCGVACVLNIEFTNTQSGSSMSVGQAMSGVSFDLSNTGTSVGSVSTAISNGSGGAVESVDGNGNISFTTVTPPRWQETLSGGVYDFTALSGGQPADLIAGAGVGSATGPGFGSHAPTLVGPVVFQITGIAGLSSATDISNVKLAFGTGPDKTITETSANCTSSQNSGGSCTNGDIGNQSPTPEPVSFLLAGSALGAFALIRRRASFPKPC